MSRTRFFNYRIAQLFPREDGYATTIARLCILWEDFITEGTGGSPSSIPQMDGHSDSWRRLYFLRRSISTLHEIRNAVYQLRKEKEFQQHMKHQSKVEQKNFTRWYAKLEKHEKVLKVLRNNLGGGHVLQKAVEEGLRRIDPTTTGILQHGEHYKDIRFKFVQPIVVAGLLGARGIADEESLFNEFMEEVARNALNIIELAFHVYVKERGIAPL